LHTLHHGHQLAPVAPGRGFSLQREFIHFRLHRHNLLHGARRSRKVHVAKRMSLGHILVIEERRRSMATKTTSQQQQTASTFEACQPLEPPATLKARPRLDVNWDELRRKISAEWRETLDFLAK
jgi:hypothetical protein